MLPISKEIKNPKFAGKITLFIAAVFLLVFCSLSATTFAQTPNNSTSSIGAATLGVARIIEVKDKNVKDGNIISATEKGAVLSNVAYDGQVQGVVARDAGILISEDGTENGVPIISVGKVYILVSTIAGPIKAGDQITTTSLIPGVGVKAVKSGYVLGVALEDYTNPNVKQTEKIVVDMNLHYFNAKPTLPGSLTDIFKIALLPTREGPTALYKYIVAAMVAIASFVLGFLTFGRTAAKGVEALGRNPAAGRIIHLGIIFNVAIVVVIALAGLTVAFLILRL
jgi:F0F1-type ATP synthase membrane subunit c/vacuolar-type H+-ATPase subunit K